MDELTTATASFDFPSERNSKEQPAYGVYALLVWRRC